MEGEKREKIGERFLKILGQRKFPKKDSLVILLLCGVLLLVIALPVSKGETDDEGMAEERRAAGMSETDGENYADYLETRLEDTLSRVSGVGKVKVMVTLGSTAEKVIEKDSQTESENVTEEDSQGGVRSTVRNSSDVVTVYGEEEQGEGGTPYVTKELSPKVEGVVVIAEGGDKGVVVQNITEAVQALFGVDTHKIKVMKLNEK